MIQSVADIRHTLCRTYAIWENCFIVLATKK